MFLGSYMIKQMRTIRSVQSWSWVFATQEIKKERNKQNKQNKQRKMPDIDRKTSPFLIVFGINHSHVCSLFFDARSQLQDSFNFSGVWHDSCVHQRCATLIDMLAVCVISLIHILAVCCSALQRVAVCCSALQCVAVRCSALLCVAGCCSDSLTCQRLLAVCVISLRHIPAVRCSALQRVAVRCSALLCVAVCCIDLLTCKRCVIPLIEISAVCAITYSCVCILVFDAHFLKKDSSSFLRVCGMTHSHVCSLFSIQN